MFLMTKYTVVLTEHEVKLLQISVCYMQQASPFKWGLGRLKRKLAVVE